MAGPKWAGWCAKRIFALIRRDFLLAMAGTALPPEEFSGLIGQPVLALAVHPAVFPRLRVMSAGRQRVVSDGLRGRGPALGWHEGWEIGSIEGWGDGFEEGREEGCKEGCNDGCAEGSASGRLIGCALGRLEGCSDGCQLGCLDG